MEHGQGTPILQLKQDGISFNHTGHVVLAYIAAADPLRLQLLTVSHLYEN